MKQQTKNGLWAGALVGIIGVMGALAGHDADAGHKQRVMSYCEGVAVFEAEKARGVPLSKRVGHRDWDDRIDVVEQCPGMRPAAPAVGNRQGILVSSPAPAQRANQQLAQQ